MKNEYENGEEEASSDRDKDEHKNKRMIFRLSALSKFFEVFKITPKPRITNPKDIPKPWEK